MVTVPSEQSASPLQPEKTEPTAGAVVSLTTVPWANTALQIVPQFMPVTLVTVPAPLPDSDRVNPYEMSLKDAEQDLAPFIVTEPSEQSASPLQPVNVEPAAGTACKVTIAPDWNAAEHLLPQSMPAGELTTFPLPLLAAVIVPTALTASV
jgi:hypothetical protein